MRQLILIIFFVFNLSTTTKAQVHWLINQDSIINCDLIKNGKFLNKETGSIATKGYTIEFKGDEVIEKMENGKYFVKSKIVFTSPCSYTSTILATNAKDFKPYIGTKLYTEILETATVDNLVKIRSKADGDWKILVLEKIVDGKKI